MPAVVDHPLHVVPAWCAEWYFRSSLDRYVWIHGMLCAFLHPWGERTLQRIDKLDLQTRLLVKTVIVAGEAGFLPCEQCRCSCIVPPAGQAGGGGPKRGANLSPCLLLSLPADKPSSCGRPLQAHAVASDHTPGLCWTTLSVLRPLSRYASAPLLHLAGSERLPSP